MAIIDSLNEIIAKNGGEVSGRGGSIENKLKTLSELSMGGGRKEYEITEGETEGSMQFFCDDPFSLRPGDILVHREDGKTGPQVSYTPIIGVSQSLDDVTMEYSFYCGVRQGDTVLMFSTVEVHEGDSAIFLCEP